MSEKAPKVGAVLAAGLASVCCWGPLLLTTFGAGALGLGAWFEPLRPYTIALTVMFLGFGFCLTYRKRPVACQGGNCNMKSSSTGRKVSMWIVAVIALALMLYPEWRPMLAGDKDEPASATSAVVDLEVTGMTCGGCVASVKSSLQKVDGVERADVVLDSSVAHVALRQSNVDPQILIAAVKDAGFGAKLRPTFTRIDLQVKGMTCDGCEASLNGALAQIPGVKPVEADYKSGSAQIEVTSEAPPIDSILAKAGKATGFTVGTATAEK